MKLLLCGKCWDVFNLKDYTKKCSCGLTSGRYINDEEAETNGEGISLAIGNGSLQNALMMLYRSDEDMPDPRKEGIQALKDSPLSVLCWVRHNSGPSNPHTYVVKGE